jgi:hypothetical protein
MRLRPVSLGLTLLLGCARSVPAPAPALEDCTDRTALTPGVPGSPGHRIASELHPEGASELATLMRAMVADLEQGRAALVRGVPLPPLWSRHRRMRCSWPTDPADRTAAYDAMAVTYLAQVQALDAKPANPRAAFNAVVAGCQACHENSCPGPLDKIASLKLPDAP